MKCTKHLSALRTCRSCPVIPILLLLVIWTSCGKQKQSEPAEKILARVGDKSISVNEFIRRSEYTVRPAYCNRDNNVHKKIVLNSLVAEKMMAIEAGDTNQFITNPNVMAYVRGLKEQAMRQWLYQKEALDKVELDSVKLKKTAAVAGRNYAIEYFNFPDSNWAGGAAAELRAKKKTFEEVVFEKTGLDTVPRRHVQFSGSENVFVLDSLFSGFLLKGRVIGPVRIDGGQFMVMKVIGWEDTPAVTRMQAQGRRREVEGIMKKREAAAVYDRFVHRVMKGLTIDFYPDAFFQVTELMAPMYIVTNEEKQEMLRQPFDEENGAAGKYDARTQLENMFREPLFKIGDRIWTVGDFVNELVVHPLVFRRTNIRTDEFGQEFKLAIVDMVRDRYLTEEAYQRGYDGINVIRRNEAMWKDNLNYQYGKSQFLKKAGAGADADQHAVETIEKYLNAYVDSLQVKYSDMIEIDVDAFNDLKLTRIDMHVLQKNVPFANAVPPFPLVTTDNKLNYGRKMDGGKNQ